ncbi:integral membrane protein [Cryptococcus neoformans C23]|uniref:TRP-like ion channel protein flc1 n=2 Tax=Cryptococcus neoformans TaxID=5207 RepID=FLC1_CRYN9|nr:integral membrane protein [Cryptococcus neoformans var. grubii H99]XP_012051707.1 integral membrane protein, variant [Cryptococcus neoformans var. grubii H99]J9VWN8.1 RecName: Full=TRP-like ion channel protein flc1; Flags: Precursor [Cryptococcus neoformans var. grubii H99]AUB26989.1 integral membrane protein [Cryptococcus neoformans var. grubii]OWZ29320.1 integral membrane protein [Cryptococcus neoformans var. grubii AD2-60a]OWZ35860.1 integral membrane protein [Cryptococcus neoformans var|eukprot:XP_012051706.1 integral membrane protein [Cryptococcus neoformans var. grubii H99]
MRIPLFILTFLFTFFSLATTPVSADSGVLYTDAVTYCAEAKAVIVDEFDITYHRSNGSVTFSFSLASVEPNLNTSVNLYINAYGIQIINQTLELCDLLQGVICPLPQVNFTGYGTYPIPAEYLSKIPSIAYTVPNIEAYARVQLIRVENNEVAACLQATLANGKTAHQKGVIWASAIFTLVAFLVAIWHTASGTSTSPIQYRWFDILFIFQVAAASGLLHLNYPLVYTNFVQNFHWALGLFYSSSMQSSISKMREKTGGSMDSTAYSEVQYINRKLSPYNVYMDDNGILSSPESLAAFFKESALSKRSLEHFAKRATIPSVLAQNMTTDINTGLPVYTNTLRIPEANAYDTIWFVFLALIGIFIAFHVLLFGMVLLFDRMGRNRSHLGWAARLRRMWWPFCVGNSLRLCLIGFFPIWIFAFWQFHIGDSGLSIFWAVFGILLTLVPLATAFLLSLLRARRISSTSPEINSLYTSFRYFHSIGVLYRQYRQKFHYFWFTPFVLAMIARAGFIAFGPASAWAQVIGNLVVEFIVLVALLACRPHKDKKGDWLGAFLSICRLIAIGLLIAFIPDMNVKPIPRAVIAFVIIVFYGVPVVFLFVGFLWNIGYGYLWCKHSTRVEDGLEVERFSPTSSNSSVPPPMMKNVDAATFVSSDGAAASRGSLSMGGAGASGAGLAGGAAAAGTGLGRRSSLIEPVGDNVYEASASSADGALSPPPVTAYNPYGKEEIGYPYDPQDSRLAYEQAAMGRGGVNGPGSPTDEKQWSRRY